MTIDRIENEARTWGMDDDEEKARLRANEQAVAGFFHASRAEAKARKKGQPKGDGPMHHRANTDWWNFVGYGKRR